jgi:hypothetical protein
MAVPMALVLMLLKDVVPAGALGYLIRLVAAGLLGGAVYLGLLWLMGVNELALLWHVIRPQSPAVVKSTVNYE